MVDREADFFCDSTESQLPPSLESGLASVQRAPLGRIFFQQTEAFSSCSHALRQVSQVVSNFYLYGFHFQTHSVISF